MPDHIQVSNNWLTTEDAARLTGYSPEYLRRLVRKRKIKAQKWANAWMVDRVDLIRYKQEMEALGPAKHDPWRAGARHKDNGAD